MEKTLGQVAYEAMPASMSSEWQYTPDRVKAAWHGSADAVIAAHEARRWQAISTAPLAGDVLVGKWRRGAWTWKKTEFIAVAIEDGYTHWTSLPAPPQEVDDAA